MRRKPHYEYERRFLVSDMAVFQGSKVRERIVQAYAFENGGFTSRIRLVQDGEPGRWVTTAAIATVKGPRTGGRRREDEAEFDDFELVEDIVAHAPYVVTKLRHSVNVDDDWWRFDVFEDENVGLVIAEIEGEQGIFAKLQPKWASKEITSDDLYNNEMLAIYPMRGRFRENSTYRAMLKRLEEQGSVDDLDN